MTMQTDSRHRRHGCGSVPSHDRRHVVRLAGSLAALVGLPRSVLAADHASHGHDMQPAAAEASDAKFAAARAAVAPAAGFQSRISLGGSVPALVAEGVIDRGKFLAAMRRPRPRTLDLDDPLALVAGYLDASVPEKLPGEVASMLDWPANAPIRLTTANAGNYLNMLWPLGLSNRMASNDDSPVNGEMLDRFASTSGWTLGQAGNGAAYFNRFPIIVLDRDQEELATAVARTTYRPCCDNSTFYQDCNHGSALLGLLELGAAQGLDEAALYREALAFNSFWFPELYAQTALYFSEIEGIPWSRVAPARVMAIEFSSMSGWQANVQRTLQRIPGLVPPPRPGTVSFDCSI